MSWFSPAPSLSDKAREAFVGLVSLCSSEASGVADCLNTIAENGDDQATDEYLVGCAENIRDYAQQFIDEVSGSADQPRRPLVATEAERDLLIATMNLLDRLSYRRAADAVEAVINEDCRERDSKAKAAVPLSQELSCATARSAVPGGQ